MADGTPARATLVHQSPSLGYSGSIECLSGPGSAMTRVKDSFIGPVVKRIEFTLDVPPTTSGVQIGYKIDNGTVQWLPTVFNEVAHFRVDVPAEAHESTSFRWTFYYSQNVKGAEQSCYTGVSTNREDILIEAVTS